MTVVRDERTPYVSVATSESDERKSRQNALASKRCPAKLIHASVGSENCDEVFAYLRHSGWRVAFR
jgi:hypothetical protein